MKTILTVALMAVALAGCSKGEEVGAAVSDGVVYKEICIDNVVYLVRKAGNSGYMSVKFNTDSTVVTCERGTK